MNEDDRAASIRPQIFSSVTRGAVLKLRQVAFDDLASRSQAAFDAYLRRLGIDPDAIVSSQ